MKHLHRFAFLTWALMTPQLLAQDFWQQTNGPSSQWVNCFALSGVNLFAGTSGGGVFVSTDNGTSWTAVSNGLPKSVYDTTSYVEVHTLAVSGTNLFAGTHGGGVFCSTDAGKNWTAVNTNLSFPIVYSLAVSGSSLFAGTWDPWFGGRVNLSMNNGESWTEANTGLSSHGVFCFAVLGTNIFAGTVGGSWDGVFLSTNNGTSWTTVSTGLPNVWVEALAVSGTNLFAATHGDGVFLSTNNGTTWTAVNGGLTYTYVLALAVSGTSLFAGTYDGVFVSTNNGTTWTAVNTGLTNTTVRSLVVDTNGYLYAGTAGDGVFRSVQSTTGPPQQITITVSPSSVDFGTVTVGQSSERTVAISNASNSSASLSGIVTITGTDFSIVIGGGTFTLSPGQSRQVVVRFSPTVAVFRSGIVSITHNATNASSPTTLSLSGTGSTGAQDFWQQTKGPSGGFVSALAISSMGHIFAGTSESGAVFRSTDNGSSWTPMNNGLSSADVHALVINPSGHIFAGTWGGGVFRSTDNGATWTQINSGLSNVEISCLAINSTGHIFAGTWGGAFRSIDNGSSWTPLSIHYLTYQSICALAINSGGDIFVGTLENGVFRSTDNGATWGHIGLTNIGVQALAINSSGHIFAGTAPDGVFGSTDNGLDWTQNGLTNIGVQVLVINSIGDIFAGTVDGVFRSTDNGASWTAINAGLSILDVRAVSINSSGHIFAGTSRGVFRSTDNGGSWTAVNTGLTNTYVNALAIDSNGYLYAGTVGGGVFRSVESTVGVGIYGRVLNIDLNLETGDSTATPISSDAEVKLFWGTSLIQSLRPAADGTFSFTGMDANQSYRVAVNASGVVPGTQERVTVTCEKEAGVATQSIIFPIPLTLLLRKYALIDTLEHLRIELELLLGFWNKEVELETQYVESRARDALQQFQNPIYERLDRTNSVLERFLIAEKLIRKIFVQASIMSLETTKTGYDLGYLFISVVTTVNKVGEAVRGLKIIPRFMTESVINLILQSLFTIWNSAFQMAVLLLPEETGTVLEKFGDAIETGAHTLISKDPSRVASEELIKELVINAANKELLSYYVSKTQQDVTNAAIKAQALQALGSLSDAYKKTLSESLADASIFLNFKLKVANDSKTVTDLRSSGNILSAASDIAALGAAATGVGILPAMLAKLTLAIPSAYPYSKALRISIEDLIEARVRTTLGVDRAFDSNLPVLFKNSEDRITKGTPGIHVNRLGTEVGKPPQSILSYDSILSVIRDRVAQNDRAGVIQSLPTLMSIDSSLSEAYCSAQAPILAASVEAIKGYTNFDSVLAQVYAAVNMSVLNRLQVYGVILQFLSDTIASHTISFDAAASAASAANRTASATIDDVRNLISGISVPGYVLVTNQAFPPYIKARRPFFLTAKFRNIGGSPADSVTARLTLGPLILGDTSQVYLGTLGIDEEKTMSWGITVLSDAAGYSHYGIGIASSNARTLSSRGVFAVALNHAPGGFTFSKPLNGDTIRLTAPPKPIPFIWRAASDIDGDSIFYTFCLKGENIDSTIAGLRDTTVELNIMSRLRTNSIYTWTASVTDGLVSVSSPDTFRFRTSGTVTAAQELAGLIPNEYALDQNYPNPFNPSTTIEFALPKSAFVTLRVYDLLGGQVGELVNEKLAPGNYRTQWNASGLASGVYFYRLQAGEFVRTRKLILLR